MHSRRNAEIPLSMANGDKNIKPTHTEWAFFKDLMEHFFKMHEVIKLHWIQWTEDLTTSLWNTDGIYEHFGSNLDINFV